MNTYKVNPACCNCGEKIGVMAIDTYCEALEKRGPLLCQHCRNHKCDVLNHWSENVVASIWNGKDHHIGSACTDCLTMGLAISYNGRFKYYSTLPSLKSGPAVLERVQQERQLGKKARVKA